jgi:hypothetical protein
MNMTLPMNVTHSSIFIINNTTQSHKHRSLPFHKEIEGKTKEYLSFFRMKLWRNW